MLLQNQFGNAMAFGMHPALSWSNLPSLASAIPPVEIRRYVEKKRRIRMGVLSRGWLLSKATTLASFFFSLSLDLFLPLFCRSGDFCRVALNRRFWGIEFIGGGVRVGRLYRTGLSFDVDRHTLRSSYPFLFSSSFFLLFVTPSRDHQHHLRRVERKVSLAACVFNLLV